MPTWMVTGGSGFLGRHLLDRLAEVEGGRGRRDRPQLVPDADRPLRRRRPRRPVPAGPNRRRDRAFGRPPPRRTDAANGVRPALPIEHDGDGPPARRTSQLGSAGPGDPGRFGGGTGTGARRRPARRRGLPLPTGRRLRPEQAPGDDRGTRGPASVGRDRRPGLQPDRARPAHLAGPRPVRRRAGRLGMDRSGSSSGTSTPAETSSTPAMSPGPCSRSPIGGGRDRSITSGRADRGGSATVSTGSSP